jgi:putative (di)nucleoside polyphosphate hydrolase
MIDPQTLPWRPNVGAVLFNRAGHIFVARRADLPNAEGAILRELEEEIGTAHASIIGEHPDWLTYDLPPDLLGVALGGRYRGQKQRWFALRFEGADSDIRLDLDPHPEFDAWRWVRLADLPSLAVPFKQAIYETLTTSFAVFAVAVAGSK